MLPFKTILAQPQKKKSMPFLDLSVTEVEDNRGGCYDYS